jgi:hypothetical protein
MNRIALLAASAVLVLAAVPGCTPNQPVQAMSTPANLDLKVVDAWHNHNALRLADLSPVMDKAGEITSAIPSTSMGVARIAPIQPLQVGTSRLSPIGDSQRLSSRFAPIQGSHPDAATASASESVRKVLDEANRAGVAYVYGSKTDPLTAANAVRTRYRDRYGLPPQSNRQEREVIAAADELARATLKTGVGNSTEVAVFRLYSRVVSLSDKDCLKCHVSSKLGDPAGVFIYAITDRLPESKASSGRNEPSAP